MLALGVALALLPFASLQAAEPRVELALFSEGTTGFQHAQAWFKVLEKASFSNLSLHAAKAGDKVRVENLGTEAQPHYRVSGQILSDGRLQLPGKVFRISDVAPLSDWVKSLISDGAASLGQRRGAFDMTVKQLEEVHADLSRPVTFQTKDISAEQVVLRIAAKLKFRLIIPSSSSRELRRKEATVRDELQGFTAGTALAAAARPAGLVLFPRRQQGKTEYLLVPAGKQVTPWPIGWPTKDSPRELTPSLSTVIEVEIDDVALQDALTAIQSRVKIPFLIDYNALAKYDINLNQKVNLPLKRTTYRVIVTSLLRQAKMKMEYRVDEVKQPFIWISSIRPL